MTLGFEHKTQATMAPGEKSQLLMLASSTKKRSGRGQILLYSSQVWKRKNISTTQLKNKRYGFGGETERQTKGERQTEGKKVKNVKEV